VWRTPQTSIRFNLSSRPKEKKSQEKVIEDFQMKIECLFNIGVNKFFCYLKRVLLNKAKKLNL
jgi:hypothetical protein